jgi:hypothetical protein
MMPKLQITRGFATRDLQFGTMRVENPLPPFQLYRNNTLPTFQLYGNNTIDSLCNKTFFHHNKPL